jgi:monoamine oxidase
MIQFRELFEAKCQKINIRDPLASVKTLGIDYDRMSMKEFVTHHGGGETALATASVWTRAMLGCEPEDVSALFFLDYCKCGGGLLTMRSDRKDGGQYLRLVKGESHCPHHICSARYQRYNQAPNLSLKDSLHYYRNDPLSSPPP